MTRIALKMLMGERSKYFAIIFGVAFACFLIAEQSAELLKINREGLIPQSRTGFQAGLAAYQNQRQDFQPLLTSYLDILRLEQENLQTLAEHETAIARLEQMTGLSLTDASKEKE